MVETDSAFRNVGRFVEAQLDCSWNQVKRWFASRKILVNGEVCDNPGTPATRGTTVEVRLSSPSGASQNKLQKKVQVVFEDTHVIVVDKPAGMSTVPYERHERNTAMDAIRNIWRLLGQDSRQPLFVVHRIDKATSGLVMFAKTKRMERGLGQLLRHHDIDREYWCEVHGQCQSRRVESWLMKDRGDGLRGSSLRGHKGGKLAISNIEALERHGRFTRCAVRLETGKTHQIRIHLSELGHPLIGDKVYTRDFALAEKDLLPSPRLLLHAASLGFVHPVTAKTVSLSSELPQDYVDAVARLRQ